LDDITVEEKREFLKKDIYGKCAYIAGGDLVDRQNLIVNFKNGSMATFTLIGGSTKADRYIHIVGTRGEIEGKLEENKFRIRRYSPNAFSGEVEEIDLSGEIVNNARFGGHSGGDYGIMHDLLAYLNGDRSSVSITSINDSVNGHMVVFGAEKSRKEGITVNIDDLKK
ncbi:MAG: Gfo/Idh/MocA family oxidoreductase, partial [Clostridia bacterium]|nr:Gfo/Idh/MocA family oxidoreductase [Clostridia bacterium]